MPSGQKDFISDVFEAWRRADKTARSAEDAVRMAFLHALDGHGATPALAERERAKSLRAHADCLLQAALDALKAQRRAGR